MLPPDKGYGTLGCLVSARYADPLGVYVKNFSYASGTNYGFHQLGAVLWCNESLPAVNLAALPKTMHFQGQGEVVTRSGFGAQDTWVYLRSGPIYNGHQHDDQGNLLVDAYGAELLVEMNGGDIHHETIFHNSIRIGGQDQIAYGNNAVQHATAIAGTAFERGKVTAVQTTSQYSYVATDFGAAYPDAVVPAPKAGKVTREVVTILPGVIVVRDRVTAAGSLDVNFHAWAGAGAIDGSGRGYTITRGSGRAFVNAVLPASATVTADGAGGDGSLHHPRHRLGVRGDRLRARGVAGPVRERLRAGRDRGEHGHRGRRHGPRSAGTPVGRAIRQELASGSPA